MPGPREGVAASTPHAPPPRFTGFGDAFPLKQEHEEKWEDPLQ